MTLWAAFLAGEWTIVDRVERQGRHHLVASRRARPRPLSLRERDVVNRLSSGASNKSLGYELGVSTSTVATHIASAMKKLGARSRMELVALVTLLSGAVDREDEVVLVLPLPATRDAWFEALSPAEREIASAILRGMSNAAIAAARRRHSRTVACQVASIYRKLAIGSRAELIALSARRLQRETSAARKQVPAEPARAVTNLRLGDRS